MNHNTKGTRKLKNIINAIPGSLIYKGNKMDEFKIERIVFNETSYKVASYFTYQDEFEKDCKEVAEDGIQWINITGLNNISEIKGIGKCFDIGTMILEQVLDTGKTSLYNFDGQYTLNSLQMIYLKEGKITTEYVSLYMTGNTIITFQERPGDVFDSIRERIKNNEGYIRSRNSFYSYFCLLDSLVDHYIDVLESIKETLEKTEYTLINDKIIDSKQLYALRKDVFLIKINATPMEKYFEEITKQKDKEIYIHKKYFDSLLQNIGYTIKEVLILEKLAEGLYQTYMMSNADRMNKVMTTLTIFSAIFIPLSFVAGVFGMNFSFLPGLNNPSAFIYFLIACLVTVLGMISFFKYKRWF